MQLELAGICFAISAFVSKSSAGIGLGTAAIMYCLNLIANIAEAAKFLKYITPYGYTEGADVIANGCLDGTKVLLGMLFGVTGIIAAYAKYCKKDIQ